MKLATTLLASILVASLLAPVAFSQDEGDYRTRASGDWSMAQNWQRFSGASWVNVATPPDGSETITVLEPDSIFVNVAATITGQLVNQGRIAEDGLLTIGNGGVYQHDRDDGTIPQATWADGSTLLITGVTAVAPADRNQSYHHVVFDTPGLLANLNMNLDEVTIGGDIRVVDTGFGRWYLTSALSNDTSIVTIQGDVIVESGNFSVHGTGNVNTTFIVHHHGDVIVTGGNFSISRGSQPLGTTTWYLHEGDFSMAGATAQNSTSTVNGARFVFASGERQHLALGEGNTLMSLPIEVRPDTEVDAGASRLAGSGHFLLEAGALLATALPGGISSIFTDVVGPVTLEEDSGYHFNGTEAQVTSARMPAVISELVIDNAAGVTLSQETTINVALRLRNGVFDNTIPFSLGPDAEIFFEGGSLLNPVSTEGADGLPQSLFVEQNFPNPVSGTTTVRFGLPSHSTVTITVYNVLGQHVLTPLDAELTAGVHEVSLDVGHLSSGAYVFRLQTETDEISRQMLVVR